jgi:hypothetical protein
MKMKKTIPRKGWPPVTLADLEEDHNEILAKLSRIEKVLKGQWPVIPELEAIIHEVSKRATSIDQKVPDKPTPMPPT